MNKKKINLLWVEDQARNGALLNCTQRLEKENLFDLTIIQYASTAELMINENHYDKIIFDIRILPGENKFWEDEYNSLNMRLGLKLIEKTIEIIKNNSTKYGIITIEEWENIQDNIMKIDNNFDHSVQYRRKNHFTNPTKIISFINELK